MYLAISMYLATSIYLATSLYLATTLCSATTMHLATQVSMCAGCNVYEPWAALVVGGGAGVTYFWIHTLMLR